MPIFFPRIPTTDIGASFPHHAGQKAQHCRGEQIKKINTYLFKASLLLNRLNLYVDTGRKIELHQRVYRLLSRLENVDEPLVGANLEGLARLLVDVGRAKDAVLVLHGW